MPCCRKRLSTLALPPRITVRVFFRIFFFLAGASAGGGLPCGKLQRMEVLAFGVRRRA